MRIGVDTGGTFTDCVTIENSRLRVLKIFSSPDDPSRNIFEGIRQLIGADLAELPNITHAIIHGTTVGTNSLIERRGARVALVTTAGFEDLIAIGRQNRPELYNLNVRREPALVSKNLRFGMSERTSAGGEILLPVRESEAMRLLRKIQSAGADSIALCFLFSFLNARNERAVAKTLRQSGLPVSVSHEILPEFREYERLSTTVINAYLAPRLGVYLARLEERAYQGQRAAKSLQSTGRTQKRLPSRIFIMQSNGGITTAARAAREPVRTILSGPAGGVVAARRLADLLRIRKAISFDMGGTSTDVCLLDGPPRTTRETTLAGLPVAVPVLDVHSVGAGGGSLARVDAGGALRVGPQSAGAVPGPACYGRGGTQPTVTDANLLLGRLDPDRFLGGDFRLHEHATKKSFEQFLRSERNRRKRRTTFATVHELALGIVAVSNALMEKALRVISVERGHDPRDFSLICFGGAGGLHAAELARSLGLVQVIVPQNPGAFSALGILLSDVVRELSQSILLPIPFAEEKSGSANVKDFFRQLVKRFLILEQQGTRELAAEQLGGSKIKIERSADLRYTGQSYELRIPFTSGMMKAFHREHEKAYGYRDARRSVEIVNLRARLVVPTPQPRLRPARVIRSQNASAAIVRRKPVWFGSRPVETSLYDRERLRPGMRFAGPAVVVEYSSTTLVPPGFACRVDEYQNLVMTHNES